jgi:hypothetical protein
MSVPTQPISNLAGSLWGARFTPGPPGGRPTFLQGGHVQAVQAVPAALANVTRQGFATRSTSGKEVACGAGKL